MNHARTDVIDLRITDVVDESHDVRTYVLESLDEHTPLTYQAGQFLNLHLPVADGASVTRTYSVSTCPKSDPYLALTVKRQQGGLGSNWLYDRARPGMTLQAQPPAGTFTLDPSDRPLLFFAAGVGITPIYSLCKFALATTTRLAHLHYSNRNPADTPFTADLRRLSERAASRFTIKHHYTDTAGYLPAVTVAHLVAQQPEAVAYVCGPGTYTSFVTEALAAADLPAERIITEAFTPPPPPPPPTPTSAPTCTAVVRLAGEEHTVAWPADRALLEALDAAGVKAPSSCRQGECLSCECRVLQGETRMVHNGALDEEDLEAGFALACQLRPLSDEVVVHFSNQS